MNWQQIEGNWKQFKGEVQRRWGELTDDDLNVIRGERKALVGKLQERYGERRAVIEKEVDDWFDSLAT